jgi:hypothetical protein
MTSCGRGEMSMSVRTSFTKAQLTNPTGRDADHSERRSSRPFGRADTIAPQDVGGCACLLDGRTVSRSAAGRKYLRTNKPVHIWEVCAQASCRRGNVHGYANAHLRWRVAQATDSMWCINRRAVYLRIDRLEGFRIMPVSGYILLTCPHSRTTGLVGKRPSDRRTA